MLDPNGRVSNTELIENLRDVAGFWADVNDRGIDGQNIVNLTGMAQCPG